MVLSMSLATAQGTRSTDTAPVLRYDPPNELHAKRYLSNASIQVYPFEPFIGKKTSQARRNSDAERSGTAMGRGAYRSLRTPRPL